MSENSKRPVSTDLTQNIEEMEFYFHDCADIKKKQMKLGRNQDTACYLTFIEVSVDMGTSALGETLKYLNGLTRDEILCTLQENALGISDATYFSTIEEAVSGLLTGEAILFVDGFDRAVKIPDDGYPNMGITEVDSEKVIRGSNEGFCDSVKQNAALIPEKDPLAPCESEGAESRDQIEHERLPCVCGRPCESGTCKRNRKEAAGFHDRWDIRQRNVRTAGREKMVFAISTVSDNAAS